MKQSLLLSLCVGFLFLSCEQESPIPASTQPIFRQLLDQEYGGNQSPPWGSVKTVSEIQSGGFYSVVDFLPEQYDPISAEAFEYRDVSLTRFDQQGSVLWSNRIGTNDFCQAKVLETLSNGNAIIAGEKVDGSGLVSAFTPWAAVVTPEGEVVWEKELLESYRFIRSTVEADNGELYFLLDTDYYNNFTQYVLRTSATGDSLDYVKLEYEPINGVRPFEGATFIPGSGLVLYGDYVVKLSMDLRKEEWSVLDKSQTIDQFVDYMDGYYENGFLYMLGRQITNQVLSDVVIKSFSMSGEPQPLIQFDRFQTDEPITFDKREAGGWVVMLEREIRDDNGLRRKVHAVGLNATGEQVFTREINDGPREVNWPRGILSLPGEVMVTQTNYLDDGYPWKLRVFQIENL